jgi:hypothetical protein
MNSESEIIWKETVMAKSRYNLGIYVNWLKKTTTYFGQDIQYLGQNSNQALENPYRYAKPSSHLVSGVDLGEWALLPRTKAKLRALSPRFHKFYRHGTSESERKTASYSVLPVASLYLVFEL